MQAGLHRNIQPWYSFPIPLAFWALLSTELLIRTLKSLSWMVLDSLETITLYAKLSLLIFFPKSISLHFSASDLICHFIAQLHNNMMSLCSSATSVFTILNLTLMLTLSPFFPFPLSDDFWENQPVREIRETPLLTFLLWKKNNYKLLGFFFPFLPVFSLVI